MAAKTESDTSSTSPENLGKIILSVILGAFFLLYVMAEYKNMKKTPATKVTAAGSQQVTQTIVIPINTTTWKVIETGGKEFESEILAVDGIKPKYFIAVNNLDNPRERPLQKENKLGDAKDIQRVYYLLKRGEPFTEARIEFKFKE